MVVYDAEDSDNLMEALSANLQGAKEVFNRLSKGSTHLEQIVDSGMLKGVAYTAGRGMFVAYVDPMIRKLDQAIDDIAGDLKLYRAADTTVRSVDTHIDEEAVRKRLDAVNKMIGTVQQRIKDNQAAIDSFNASSSASAASALGNQYHRLHMQLDKLDELNADYNEELSALRTFADNIAPLFKDSAQVFNDAMRGVKAINSSYAAADGSIIFPAGTDMGWLAALQKDKLGGGADPNRLPSSYRAEVKEIQNDSNLNPQEKADRIEKVYETWLHSLAPAAFDEYAKTRRKYPPEPGKPLDPHLIEAEKKLSKALHGTHIDIRKTARNLGGDVAKISGTRDYGQFYNMVQTGHPLDLKNRMHDTDTYSIWSRGWDGNPTNKDGTPKGDFLGNYLYGYYGSSVGFDPGTLHGGAGTAQVISDWSKLHPNFHGDNQGDAEDIDEGIKDHDKAHIRKHH